MQVVEWSSSLGPDTKITFEGVCRAIAFTVHLNDQMLTQTEVSGVDARYRLARDKEKCNPPSTIVVEEQKWPFCDPLSLFCLFI